MEDATAMTKNEDEHLKMPLHMSTFTALFIYHFGNMERAFGGQIDDVSFHFDPRSRRMVAVGEDDLADRSVAHTQTAP